VLRLVLILSIYDVNLGEGNILLCNIKVQQWNKVLRVASAYGKEVEDDIEICKIKMSNIKHVTVKWWKFTVESKKKNREGGRKGTVRFFRSLTSYKLHGVLSKNIFISIPCYVRGLSKGLLKTVFPSTLTLFSLKSCFQFHNNAFNQARVLKADVQRNLIFHSLYAHANTHACTGILYANAANRGVYFVSVYGVQY
jgi:hypothetical protein